MAGTWTTTTVMTTSKVKPVGPCCRPCSSSGMCVSVSPCSGKASECLRGIMRRRTLTNTHLLRTCQGSSPTCRSGNKGSLCRPKSTWCKVLDGKCKMYIKNLKKMQLTSSWLHVWTACGSSCPEKCKGKIGRVSFLTWWHKHRQPHCLPNNQVGRSSPIPSLRMNKWTWLWYLLPKNLVSTLMNQVWLWT